MRAFPQGANQQMLRRFPNSGMDMGMQNHMDMMMQQNMQMGMPMNMMPNMPPQHMPIQMDPETMKDPVAKRDFFGESLYSKISSDPKYQNISELFSRIVGIFLDLEDPLIEKLINDNQYFDTQVRETVRLLAEKNN